MATQFRIDRASAVPVYVQLAEQIRLLINVKDSLIVRRFNVGVWTRSVQARPEVPVPPAERRPMEWRLRPFWP